MAKIIGLTIGIELSYCCCSFFSRYTSVHCRTGSLETQPLQGGCAITVHCRTGSLEI